ncbi:ProQ/FINO family protein [Methylocella tundrae]|uniref:ProQ/FINO family protein n=1 Tax=Methylocella tundrae TaxID=227605 RepID=UPI00157A43E6|nr:ProQ/FINO family protein [Methylocella tundrae]
MGCQRKNHRRRRRVALVLADWARRWPAVFGKPAPLAIGFFEQIHAELKPQFSHKEVRLVLHRWTTRPAYYQAVERGDPRRNLDGSEAGLPDEVSRALARTALAAIPHKTANANQGRAAKPASGAPEDTKAPAKPRQTRQAAL